jgi:hypothetical protein
VRNQRWSASRQLPPESHGFDAEGADVRNAGVNLPNGNRRRHAGAGTAVGNVIFCMTL